MIIHVPPCEMHTAGFLKMGLAVGDPCAYPVCSLPCSFLGMVLQL